LRNASNASEILNQIRDKTGISVQIISGEEEAKLIYYGVRSAVALGKDKCLIMDIGGGSVEFIIANESEIFWKQSFEVGGQRLLEKFHQHDPILKEELDGLQDYLASSLQSLANVLKKFNPKTLVGSSGTFETLSDIYCERKQIPNQRLPNSPMSLAMFPEIYQDIIRLNKGGRIAMPGMMEWRAEMIVVTCS